ncbi:MAG: hypothetical protein ABWW69_04095 [Pyrodictiaceae archaeon]
MDELDKLITIALDECRRSGWAKAKLVLAEAIARIMSTRFRSVKKIYLVDLSGGEYSTSLEGGFDIDLYVEVDEAEEDEVRAFGDIIDDILRKLVHAKLNDKDCSWLTRRSHNILELHVNSEFVRPLVENRGRPKYAVRLFEA